jgi:hypothetical protein
LERAKAGAEQRLRNLIAAVEAGLGTATIAAATESARRNSTPYSAS